MMKKTIIHYWLFLIAMLPLLFSSCSEKVQMEETNKTFYVSHDYNPNCIVLLNHNENTYCLAYFAKTDKRIEVSNIRNHGKDVIKLPENVSGQMILSTNPDTIYVCDHIYDEIHLITNDGYKETLDLSASMGRKNYEFYPPGQIYNNTLYVSGYHSSKDYSSDNSFKAEARSLLQNLENERVFVFENLFTDSLYIEQILKNFVHAEIVTKADHTGTYFLKTRVFNNDLICFHVNSNVLYVFDRTSGDIEEKIKLSSEYSDLKAPLIPLYSNKQERDDYLRKRQESAFLNGIIYNIVYDEFHKLFFVTTLLPSEDFHYRNNLTIERDWSLIVLDNEYNELGEFLFNGDKFDFRTVHPVKEGLLIKKQNEKDEKGKTEFALFQVS